MKGTRRGSSRELTWECRWLVGGVDGLVNGKRSSTARAEKLPNSRNFGFGGFASLQRAGRTVPCAVRAFPL